MDTCFVDSIIGLKTDMYCATVDEALSKDMEASNDFGCASDGVKKTSKCSI